MSEHTHLNCEALLGSLSEYIDGNLTPELCREIEKHLAGCDNCRAVLNTTKRSIDLVRDTRQPGLPDDVRARLLKRLNLDDYLKRTDLKS
jgi:anti-sigma factor (TIGR02949 family)